MSCLTCGMLGCLCVQGLGKLRHLAELEFGSNVAGALCTLRCVCCPGLCCMHLRARRYQACCCYACGGCCGGCIGGVPCLYATPMLVHACMRWRRSSGPCFIAGLGNGVAGMLATVSHTPWTHFAPCT